MTDRDRPAPEEMPVRSAQERYLRRRSADSTEQSVTAWRYRLKLFTEFCEGIGVDRVGDLQRFDIDEYFERRASSVAPATLEGEMHTLSSFIEFLEDLGAVDDGLADAVRIPNVDQADRVDETKLETDRALALLRFYRNSPDWFGTRTHVWLELAWITGARQGGLRALDIRDVDLDGMFLFFKHRPPQTPLKNGLDGERPVTLPDQTVAALERYIDHHRYDVRDEHDRQPLLASRYGRPEPNTVRTWSYQATLPCVRTDCPHGRERGSCEYTEFAHASKCPSSRSPHQIRTGAITWLLNLGWDQRDVAERVNAAEKTIEQHYDQADRRERHRRMLDRMETRRRDLTADLDSEISDATE